MRNGSILLISDGSKLLESKTQFRFEQRAASALFKIIDTAAPSGPLLLPANICPIVPLVLHKARCTFEFIDIDRKTLCLDHQAIIRRWMEPQNRPAGIVYVRGYGALFDTATLFAKIKSLSPHALIVDDRCLCPPDFSPVIPDNIDAILYSTGYAKYVDIGFGGFALLRPETPYAHVQLPFNEDDLDKLIKQYKSCLEARTNFSYRDSNWLDTTPPNMKWKDYCQQVENARRRVADVKEQINSIYTRHLSPNIQFSNIFQTWRFNIDVENKAEILSSIQAAGLFASSHYESLAGLFGPGQAPVAERLHKHTINLFNDRYFSVEKAGQLTTLLTALNPSPPGQPS